MVIEAAARAEFGNLHCHMDHGFDRQHPGPSIKPMFHPGPRMSAVGMAASRPDTSVHHARRISPPCTLTEQPARMRYALFSWPQQQPVNESGYVYWLRARTRLIVDCDKGALAELCALPKITRA